MQISSKNERIRKIEFLNYVAIDRNERSGEHIAHIHSVGLSNSDTRMHESILKPVQRRKKVWVWNFFISISNVIIKWNKTWRKYIGKSVLKFIKFIIHSYTSKSKQVQGKRGTIDIVIDLPIGNGIVVGCTRVNNFIEKGQTNRECISGGGGGAILIAW